MLPVATLSIALYVYRKSNSSSDVAPEVCNSVIIIKKNNKKRELSKATGLAQTPNALQQDEIPILRNANN